MKFRTMLTVAITIFAICTTAIFAGQSSVVTADTEPSCFDSDGGIAPLISGSVSGIGNSGYPYEKFDVCLDADNLKEFYCNGIIPWPKSELCANGCLDGVCVSLDPTPTPTLTPTPGPTPTPTSTQEPSEHRNILIIGWDGTQRDHLYECLNGLLPECNNMQTLPSMPVLINTLITSGATDTKAGWSQLISGYRAEDTGIFGNGDYNPLPVGYSIFEKIENAFGDFAVNTFFISGKGQHTGDACIGEQTYCGANPCTEPDGQPYCYMSDNIDFYHNGTYEPPIRRGEEIRDLAIQYITDHQDEWLVGIIIFREPDVIGHISGENSVQYGDYIQRADTWTGDIIQALISLGIYNNTDLYIVTDHGFDEGASVHHYSYETWLATNNTAVIRDGDRMDLAPTILHGLGLYIGDLGGTPLTSE